MNKLAQQNKMSLWFTFSGGSIYKIRGLPPGIGLVEEMDRKDEKIIDRRKFLRLTALAATGLAASRCSATKKSHPLDRPNIVLILTDDQRWDTLWAMPILQKKMASRSITFKNAFMTTPVCCPARASLLAGGFYAHHTGVLTNSTLNGSIHKFQDTKTLPTLLQKAGYATGFVGKYMHEYRPGYIPPGWTKFVANNNGGMLTDWFNLVDVTVGSSRDKSAEGKIIEHVEQYITDFQRDKALEFIDQYGDERFFLLLSTYAPHGPFTPAPGDEALFPGYFYNARACREQDLSDKPLWVQKAAVASEIPRHNESHAQRRLRSLAALDRAVGAVIDSVRKKGVWDKTVFIFTSDNGLTWGEHGVMDKGMPYEEAIRVPLVIAMPGAEAREDDHLIAANLDIGATLFDLAKIPRKTDGLSLVPVLTGTADSWREELLIQDFGYLYYLNRRDGFKAPGLGIWAGLRTKNERGEWKYVEHPTGEKELYDLRNDPYEEESRHNDPAYHEIMQDLSNRLEKRRGLSIIIFEAPEGRVRDKYSFRMAAWGSKKPYTWEIIKGRLPEGLALNRSTGLVSGIPEKPESQSVQIRVTGSSIARHTGEYQSFNWIFAFHIESR
jgi:arylsulfatase A-like enzyme